MRRTYALEKNGVFNSLDLILSSGPIQWNHLDLDTGTLFSVYV